MIKYFNFYYWEGGIATLPFFFLLEANMDKWEMIGIISHLCRSPYGELLVEMMDKYGKNSLVELTEDEVKEFFINLINAR